jgi:putative phosphoribosyl transferase
MNKMTSITKDGRPVKIEVDSVSLDGILTEPAHARGLVIFIHESGSNRFNPTDQYIARRLNKAGMATLLFDLLDDREAEFDKVARHLRFDIDFMVRRATAVTDWAMLQTGAGGLNTGYFGRGRGAATALIAASQRPQSVGAIVSLVGRPDLAKASLHLVKAPTLLVVGMVRSLLALNQAAMEELPWDLEKRLEIFNEVSYFWGNPGTLEKLSSLVNEWFERLEYSSMDGMLQSPSGLVPVA